MARENLNDIVAFLAVAREKNFTKAAAKLGVSQSALSHTIRALETRLGLRLLTRTTRSVSPTGSGRRTRLSRAVGPHFEDIRAALEAMGALRDKPSGNVRITAGLHVTETILGPSCSQCCESIPRSKSRSSSTTASPTSWPTALTPAFAWRSRSPRTWWLYVSARIFASSWWRLPQAYQMSDQSPGAPKELTSHIVASICACPLMVASMPGNSSAGVGRSMCAWMGSLLIQLQQADPGCSARGFRIGLSARGHRVSLHRARPPATGSRPVVRAISWLSHLLPDPPPWSSSALTLVIEALALKKRK